MTEDEDTRTVDMLEELDSDDEQEDDEHLEDLERMPRSGRRRIMPVERLR